MEINFVFVLCCYLLVSCSFTISSSRVTLITPSTMVSGGVDKEASFWELMEEKQSRHQAAGALEAHHDHHNSYAYGSGDGSSPITHSRSLLAGKRNRKAYRSLNPHNPGPYPSTGRPPYYSRSRRNPPPISRKPLPPH